MGRIDIRPSVMPPEWDEFHILFTRYKNVVADIKRRNPSKYRRLVAIYNKQIEPEWNDLDFVHANYDVQLQDWEKIRDRDPWLKWNERSRTEHQPEIKKGGGCGCRRS